MCDLYDSRMGDKRIASLASTLSFSLGEDKSRAVAQALLDRFGDIDIMNCATVEELGAVEGVTNQAAMLLKLAAYISSRRVTDKYPPGKLMTDEQIEEYLSALFIGLSVETVYLLLFDEKGRFIGCEYMGEGTVNTSDVYPRRIVECAVRKGAVSVILAHNHPRGRAEASVEDMLTTTRLGMVLKSSGVKLIGHYIVSEHGMSRADADEAEN